MRATGLAGTVQLMAPFNLPLHSRARPAAQGMVFQREWSLKRNVSGGQTIKNKSAVTARLIKIATG